MVLDLQVQSRFSRLLISRPIQFVNLTDDEINVLRTIIDEQYQTEGDLRRVYSLNIKRLTEIGSAQGRRHRVGLPADSRVY